MPTPDFEFMDKAFLAAFTGILADPEDRSDELLTGETCTKGVARIAWEHAVQATLLRRSFHERLSKLTPPTR